MYRLVITVQASNSSAIEKIWLGFSICAPLCWLSKEFVWIINLTLGRICEFCHSQFESISINIFKKMLDYFHGWRSDHSSGYRIFRDYFLLWSWIAFFFLWYSASVINFIICSLLCVTNEKCLESCCLSLNFVVITEKSEMVMIFWYVVYDMYM